MAHLSTEAKQSVLSQALNRGHLSVATIAKNNNVGYSTLQRWLRNTQNGKPITHRGCSGKGLIARSTEEKFTHLLATNKLDEVDLGKYCRQHGLYSHQLTEWRKAFMQQKTPNGQSDAQAQLKHLRVENKKLRRELQRKEKALAEASAFLIL